MNNLTNQQFKAMTLMLKEHGKIKVEDKIIDEMNITMDIPNLTPITSEGVNIKI